MSDLSDLILDMITRYGWWSGPIIGVLAFFESLVVIGLFVPAIATMIAVGGLSEFAAGNRARLVRFDKNSGKQKEYRVRLNDLLKRGDTKANVMLAPGDVIIIPESMF